MIRKVLMISPMFRKSSNVKYVYWMVR